MLANSSSRRGDGFGRLMRYGGKYGYTLIEVLIAVVIIGVLASISVSSLNSFLRRERVNAVALSLYGWLNEVRQASLRLQGNGESCTVSFQLGQKTPGQELASVPSLNDSSSSNTECRTMLGNQRVSLALDSDFTRGLPVSFAANQAQVTFTPRTLTTNADDIVIGMVVNSQGPQRCIRISAISGFIQIGRNDSSANPASTCSYSALRGF